MTGRESPRHLRHTLAFAGVPMTPPVPLSGEVHGRQRLRPLQDRHRAVELPHGGADARRPDVRPPLVRAGRAAGGRADQGGTVRLPGRHGQGARQRQGRAAGACGSRAGPRGRGFHSGAARGDSRELAV